MRQARQRYKVLTPIDGDWNKFQDIIKKNPELKLIITTAADGRSYVPSETEADRLIQQAETIVNTSVEEEKNNLKAGSAEETLEKDGRNIRHLLFPTYENTVEHINDLKREYPKFMSLAISILKSPNGINETLKESNFTEEEKTLWYDLVSTLKNYYSFNNLKESTKKK